MSKDLFTHLILKQFQGTITKEEQRELERWLKEDDSHRQLYEQLKVSWNNAEDYKADFQVDLDKGWSAISSKIEPVNKSKLVIPFYQRSVFRIAASVVLLLGIAWMVATFFNSSNSKNVWASVTTLENEVKSITLPDSSEVWLNENSELKYLKQFKSRSVQLKGEAEFSVQHDAEHPFKVDAAGTKTTVLGTTFNVSTKDNEVDVSLIEGRVSFESPEANTVFLSPGQTANYDSSDKSVKVIKTNSPNFNAWKTGVLSFDRQPIDNVIKDLQAYFDIEIQLQNESNVECLFTGTFKEPSYKEVLEVLAFTFDLNQSEENNIHTLVIKNCQ
ncbi:MAG: FecR domain-containing protein [Chitinophagales bacterium]